MCLCFIATTLLQRRESKRGGKESTLLVWCLGITTGDSNSLCYLHADGTDVCQQWLIHPLRWLLYVDAGGK